MAASVPRPQDHILLWGTGLGGGGGGGNHLLKHYLIDCRSSCTA